MKLNQIILTEKQEHIVILTSCYETNGVPTAPATLCKFYCMQFNAIWLHASNFAC